MEQSLPCLHYSPMWWSVIFMIWDAAMEKLWSLTLSIRYRKFTFECAYGSCTIDRPGYWMEKQMVIYWVHCSSLFTFSFLPFCWDNVALVLVCSKVQKEFWAQHLPKQCKILSVTQSGVRKHIQMSFKSFSAIWLFFKFHDPNVNTELSYSQEMLYSKH